MPEFAAPFYEFPGLEVLAGFRHSGDDEGEVKAIAGFLMSALNQLGRGDKFELIEHPIEDVLYVCLEVDREAAKVNDLEVVETPKALIIPGQRPVSGGLRV